MWAIFTSSILGVLTFDASRSFGGHWYIFCKIGWLETNAHRAKWKKIWPLIIQVGIYQLCTRYILLWGPRGQFRITLCSFKKMICVSETDASGAIWEGVLEQKSTFCFTVTLWQLQIRLNLKEESPDISQGQSRAGNI